MSLTCECDYDYEAEPGDWQYWHHNPDFAPLDTTRRKRCRSCGELIDIGSPCIKYPRRRYPYSEAEARIEGLGDLEDSLCNEPVIKMADYYHCEKCGEIYLNLTDIGYECISPGESMPELLKEYHELSGFQSKQNKLNTNEMTET